MRHILHVDHIMFHNMQDAATKADFYGTDPSILALRQTGIDWRVLGGEVQVVVDMETPDDRPDGVCRLETLY